MMYMTSMIKQNGYATKKKGKNGEKVSCCTLRGGSGWGVHPSVTSSLYGLHSRYTNWDSHIVPINRTIELLYAQSNADQNTAVQGKTILFLTGPISKGKSTKTLW